MADLNEQTLLPCPMCGGTAQMQEMDENHMVMCHDCGVNYEGPTPEDCAIAWNRRQHGSAAQAVAWAWWMDGQPMTEKPAGVCDYEPTAYPQRRPLVFAAPPVADTEGVKDVATKIAERLDSVAASATERNDIMLAECLSSVAVMARVMTRMIDLAALSRLNGEKK